MASSSQSSRTTVLPFWCRLCLCDFCPRETDQMCTLSERCLELHRRPGGKISWEISPVSAFLYKFLTKENSAMRQKTHTYTHRHKDKRKKKGKWMRTNKYTSKALFCKKVVPSMNCSKIIILSFIRNLRRVMKADSWGVEYSQDSTVRISAELELLSGSISLQCSRKEVFWEDWFTE